MVKGVPTAITYILYKAREISLPAFGDGITGRTHVDKLDNGSTGKIRKIKITITSVIIQKDLDTESQLMNVRNPLYCICN